MDSANQPAPLSNGLLLYVDLQPDELLISSPDGPAQFKGLDMNWFETLNRIKNIPIKQTSEENLETAVTLMKSTYNFYRESSCGTFPSGINLYTVTPSHVPIEGLPQAPPVIETLDLSIPRKLLLWVYTLVHGRYSNISSVVKYCDEMKVWFVFLVMGSSLSVTFSISHSHISFFAGCSPEVKEEALQRQLHKLCSQSHRVLFLLKVFDTCFDIIWTGLT